MRRNKSEKKQQPIAILWAIALDERDRKLLGVTIPSLRSAAPRYPLRIEPVHVVQDKGLNLPRESLETYFRPFAEEKLKSALEGIQAPELQSPTVLTPIPNHHRAAAHELDQYARRKNLDWIAVQSHGRRGISRAVLGSFAETLMLQSQTPVLIIGPEYSSAVSRNPDLLFPTDFGPRSDAMFRMALTLARRIGVRLTVLHVNLTKLEYALDPAILRTQSGAMALKDFSDRLWKTYQRKASAWQRAAESAGVQFKIIFETDAKSPVEGILEHIQRHPPALIALVSQSEQRFPGVLGSTSRELARRSKRPVLIWRMKESKTKK